jgi:hypothetical protein
MCLKQARALLLSCSSLYCSDEALHGHLPTFGGLNCVEIN